MSGDGEEGGGGGGGLLGTGASYIENAGCSTVEINQSSNYIHRCLTYPTLATFLLISLSIEYRYWMAGLAPDGFRFLFFTLMCFLVDVFFRNLLALFGLYR